MTMTGMCSISAVGTILHAAGLRDRYRHARGRLAAGCPRMSWDAMRHPALPTGVLGCLGAPEIAPARLGTSRRGMSRGAAESGEAPGEGITLPCSANRL